MVETVIEYVMEVLFLQFGYHVAGVALVFIGLSLIIADTKRKESELPKYSLIRRLLGSRADLIVTFLANIMHILLGLACLIFTDNLAVSVVIGLLFMLAGMESMVGKATRNFIGSDFFEERYSEKINYRIGLMVTIAMFLLGTSVILWHFLVA